MVPAVDLCILGLRVYMKKHYVMIILMTVFMLASCDDADSDNSGSNIETMHEQNAWMEARIAELQEENAALRSEISILQPDSDQTVESEAEDIEIDEDEENENNEG